MKRVLIAAAVLCLSIAAPLAQTIPTPIPTGTTGTETTAIVNCGVQGSPACTPPIAAPAATQNTITTTGPVSSTTKIETGTIAGEAILWVGSVFGTTIGAALTALILRLLKNAGFAGSEVLRQKLQDMIVNGLNAGAAQAADALKDKGQIEVKNEVVAKTVKYVQAHGAETLKKLGLDPTSPAAVEAIKARIETAINDPAAPTPPALDPEPAEPKAAA